MARVSSEEQAKGYSLDVQKNALLKYSERNGIECARFFREDHSAKNFDRPEWKKLMVYAKANKGEIKYLIFTSWDRFSRNITDALIQLRKLDQLGISPIAIEQPLDLSVPENKAILANYLAMPEIDNDRRSIKIRGGIRGSLKAGRWGRGAPRGYSNVRDENNKPIIVPNKDAKHVQYLFKEIAAGKTQTEVRLKLKSKGFIMGKNGISKMLRNIVYLGKIIVPAFEDEQLEIVEGVHEGIIDSQTFNKVQEVLDENRIKRKRPKSSTRREELPLRGNLICSNCNSKMTGSASRSATGRRYFYYHCGDCKQERYRAEKANESVEAVLAEMKFKKGAKKLYAEIVKQLLNGDEKERVKTVQSLQKIIHQNEERVNSLQDLLVDGKIEPSEFGNMKKRYMQNVQEAKQELDNLNGEKSSWNDWMKNGINGMSNLSKLYESSTLIGKHQIVSSIFPENLNFDGKKCRTFRMNEAMRLILFVDRGLEKNKKGQIFKNLDLSPQVESGRIELPSKQRTNKPSTCLFYN